MKALVKESPLTAIQIVKKVGMEPARVKKNLTQLEREGFIKKKGGTYVI